MVFGNRGETRLTQAAHAGLAPRDFVLCFRRKHFPQSCSRIRWNFAVWHRRNFRELVPKILGRLDRFDAQALHVLGSFGENKRAAALLQRFRVAFQNRVAPLSIFDGQRFRVGDHFHAGGETHQVVGVGQGIGVIEIVDAPAQSPFRVTPGSETSHVEIAAAQNLWRMGQVFADFRK